MHLFFGFCILCLAVCTATPTEGKETDNAIDQEFNKGNVAGDSSGSGLKRIRRAGLTPIVILLGKARRSYKIGLFRQFVRNGGYEQAAKDFESLNPSIVKISKDDGIIEGRVGAADVILSKKPRPRESKKPSSGQGKEPWLGQLTIVTHGERPFTRKGTYIDSIQYFE